MIIIQCDNCDNTDQNHIMYELMPINDTNGYLAEGHLCDDCLAKIKEGKYGKDKISD